MSDNIKLIIELPKAEYELIVGDEACGLNPLTRAIAHGTPLDDVKNKIETDLSWDMFDEYGNETGLHKELMQILDNISEEKYYE